MQNRLEFCEQVKVSLQKYEAIEQFSIRAESIKNEANKFFKENMFDVAIELYTKAIELDKSVAIFYSNRCQAFMKMKFYVSAVADASKAIEIDPSFVKAYYHRATANMALDNFELAFRDLIIVVRDRPQDDDVKQKLDECKNGVRLQKRAAIEKTEATNQENTGNDVSGEQISFVEQAIYWFEKMHPKWKEAFNASPLTKETETVCIPDALFASEERNTVEQAGKKAFFEAFRQLKLGGILISGFNTQRFIEKFDKGHYAEWTEKGKHFECDSLFFHHQLGAFIVETKNCEQHLVSKRCMQATVQLNRSIPGMKEIYRKITKKECPFNFQGIICIPKANNQTMSNIFKVIGKKEMENLHEFRSFFLSGYLSNATAQDPITNDVLAFLAKISGYRSAIFAKVPTSALEINRIINQQMETRILSSELNCLEIPFLTDKGITIRLDDNQLNALKCQKQHITIRGPPGSGRTTLMLHRALAAAKWFKPGCVIILDFSYGVLIPLFMKFLTVHKYDIEITRPILIRNWDGQYEQGDDVFCDEIHPFDFRIEKLSQRPKSTGTGTTTIVMSGWIIPSNVANASSKLFDVYPGFHQYHHIQLNTVYRGTLNIIDEYKEFFPQLYMVPGHNVKGAKVERVSVIDSRAQLYAAIEQSMKSLLNTENATDLSDNFCFSPQHLAVLLDATLSYGLVRKVRKYLMNKGYPCGNVADQLAHGKTIVVDNSYKAFSCEWPALVLVLDHTRKSSNTTYTPDNVLIGVSRCIAKLIIIEYEDLEFDENDRTAWVLDETINGEQISPLSEESNADRIEAMHVITSQSRGGTVTILTKDPVSLPNHPALINMTFAEAINSLHLSGASQNA